MAPARALFFGSGPFAVAVLDAVVGAPELAAAAVVTAPARPVGRRGIVTPTPVEGRARSLGLAVLAPARLRDPAFVATLVELDLDVGILADYGKLLPPPVLDSPRRGILNLHPSLLPRHRCATPVPAAILAGDAETGVTLFRMDAGMDTGPVLAADRVAVGPDEDAPQLEERLAAVAAGLLRRAIGPYLRGDLVPAPQPEAGVTVTRPLRREDAWLDPALAAADLERRVRAFRPWPGAYLELTSGRLAVLRAAAVPGDAADEPGTLVADGRGLALATVSGRLSLALVQPAGGRPMDAAAFLRGHPGAAGARAMGPAR